MREPLLLPLAALAAGISLSRLSPFDFPAALFAFAALLLLALLAAWRCGPAVTRTAVFAAAASAGVMLDTLHRPGPPPEIDATSQEVVTLSGCVVEPPVSLDDREQFLLELEPGAIVRVTLTLRPGDKPPAIRYGQRIEVDARVRKPRNFGNPGAFDYIRYLARRNVYWTATAPAGTTLVVIPGHCGNRLAEALFNLRQSAMNQLARLYAGDEYAIRMMEAVLIGGSAPLERSWTEPFRRTGTYHALVISGLHVTVLAGVLLFLLRIAMLNEIAALLIAAAGAWVYAAVSGWSAPVIRAAGGFTIYLAGRFVFRRGRILNILAAVALVFLAVDPSQLFDASFQLSFFAVAAIGALAVPLLDRTSAVYREAARDLHDRGWDPRMQPEAAALRVELRLLAEAIALWTPVKERVSLAFFAAGLRAGLWLFEMAVVSAVVQISLALPMVFYFHRLSVTGVSANLLIVPALSAVVPIGFAAVFSGSTLLAGFAQGLLRFSEVVARWHARLEPSHRIPDPPLWLGAALVLSLALLAFALRRRWRHRWLAGAVALGFFALMFVHPFPPDIEPGVLELTAVDVGQGDSLFVAFPDGRTMLVDAGGILSFGRSKPRMDIGEDVVSPYLWTRGIRRLDVIAISHAHEDHIGGLTALLENFRPGELWTGATPPTGRWQGIERRARELGVRVIPRRAGERIGAVEIIAPPRDYEPSDIARNNDSLAMRIRFGMHTLMLMGDLERQVEYQLGDPGRATVLKVAHHGSRTSSTEEFIAGARPTFALISAGFENSFRHPHPEVLARLAAHHSTVLRTDLDGLITIRSDGHRLSVSRLR